MTPAHTPQRILVLGASGYIGGHLLPLLAAQGHQIIATSRDIEAMEALPAPNITYGCVDLLEEPFPTALLRGIDTLYYLVHSMGDGSDFVQREQCAAKNLCQALQSQPVGQIIYLSALQGDMPSASPHLYARQQTGDLLRQSGVAVIELQAGMVIGPGSAAFEVMRDMINNLPVLTPPRWVRSRTTPIALSNLLYYLVQLLRLPRPTQATFRAGGPEILSYQQQFERFMALSGRHRPLIPLPFPLNWISTGFLSMITSVPAPLAQALIRGLKHDLIADSGVLEQCFPQRLIPFDEAVQEALQQTRQLAAPHRWGYSSQATARWRGEYGFFAKQAGHTVRTQASLAQLWAVVNQLGGPEGYFFAYGLWRIRACLDRLLGHKLPQGRPAHPYLQVGDMVDSWQVLVAVENKELSLLFGMKAPGLGRLTFKLVDKGNYRTLDVRAWWHPAGMPGLLYWLTMAPAHLFIFRGMAQQIAHLAEINRVKIHN